MIITKSQIDNLDLSNSEFYNKVDFNNCTFKIPKGEKIDISDPLAKFTNVNKHWARESIAYIVKKNLFKGTTETTFS